MVRIILSQDRKHAVVHFETHSVMFHSDTNVLLLLWDLGYLKMGDQNESIKVVITKC